MKRTNQLSDAREARTPPPHKEPPITAGEMVQHARPPVVPTIPTAAVKETAGRVEPLLPLNAKPSIEVSDMVQEARVPAAPTAPATAVEATRGKVEPLFPVPKS